MNDGDDRCVHEMLERSQVSHSPDFAAITKNNVTTKVAEGLLRETTKLSERNMNIIF